MRLGSVDCEIGFGAPADDKDLLFHDLMLPVVSPGLSERIDRLGSASPLEAFILLHPDFYKDDPAMSSWPRWLESNGIARAAPDQGMRYRRLTGLLDSIAADAGIALCGLALISDTVDEGRIVPTYPAATARETGHAFIAG